MKIALVTFAEHGPSYETMPRGTFAYLHYLKRFGHEVRFFDRCDCRRPFRLLRELRRWKPDVVLGQHAGAMAAGLFRRFGGLSCPVVHVWDDYYDEQSGLPGWFIRPLEKMSVMTADHITSVSRFNVHRAETWGKSATFIPHGVEENQRPGSLVLKSARLKVVYLGDQSLYKGMLRLMDAMRGLEADLFMVGTVNPALQAQAPGNVHFVGRVPPQEVQSALRQADVLVNPSDQDSNFKLQEYILAGKPILGVEGRMGLAFEHGQNVWLTDDLRAGLLRLKEDAPLRARLAENVAKLSVLTWEQVARKLESALSSVIDRIRN